MPTPNRSESSPRDRWLKHLEQLATPVLTIAANRQLKARLPVEGKRDDRPQYTHLEAIGRLLCGLAPWLALDDEALAKSQPHERETHARLLGLTRQAMTSIVDPDSPDMLNFTRGRQPIVDAAFLAQAYLRAPCLIADGDQLTRDRLLDALLSTRVIRPGFNNWLLFSATVEAAIHQLGGTLDPMRVDYALRQHEQWYVGDGTYSDGPEFHWDYYNSLVIHPMLIDVLAVLAPTQQHADLFMPGQYDRVMLRAQRFANLLERLIAPDGTFPPIGRSLAYRCGAFHLLAQLAWREQLPDTLTPAQVREALTAVIERSLSVPGTFDEQGFLRIGFCGAQPSIGETYISTGSLYLCTAALLPLGLPTDNPFWSDRPAPFTQQRAWSGVDIACDKALKTAARLI